MLICISLCGDLTLLLLLKLNNLLSDLWKILFNDELTVVPHAVTCEILIEWDRYTSVGVLARVSGTWDTYVG